MPTGRSRASGSAAGSYRHAVQHALGGGVLTAIGQPGLSRVLRATQFVEHALGGCAVAADLLHGGVLGQTVLPERVLKLLLRACEVGKDDARIPVPLVDQGPELGTVLTLVARSKGRCPVRPACRP